ncbi:MAG: N-formylglutamate amidohydrolase [Pseudomonadota bacterium]
MTKNFDALVLTCEHGGNEVPAAYTSLFAEQTDVLATHRGWDIGALAVAQGLAKSLDLPLHYSTTTRLLIDLNRSLNVKGVWSTWSRELDHAEQSKIIERYYAPYRNAVEDHLTQLVTEGKRVLHLSIHSFTPVLNGETRKAEVGILYDPKRNFEAAVARTLCAAVRAEDDALQVRKNYPYVGYSNGFTTALRRKLPMALYAGIEIETRQDEIAAPVGQRRFIDTYTRAIQRL